MKRHSLCGAEVLDRGHSLPFTNAAKVGLITGPTAIAHDGTPTFEILRRHFSLCAMFSPEHGVRGNLQAGAKVSEYIDDATGIPVYSTYGEARIRSDSHLCFFLFLSFLGRCCSFSFLIQIPYKQFCAVRTLAQGLCRNWLC